MLPLKYRSDIDGLRAVAVLGVVIYHAFPKLIPGGFIGVDIFFVISGYLISGILYKGHREGGFSFREFYARRIRRLFPALIVMFVLCGIYGWMVLLPDEFQRMGKRMATGLLFVQNFSVWHEAGYFDIASNLKPMLHLWSLAVEEQFYIIFPLLLLLLWKRGWGIFWLLICLLLASLAGSVMMSYWNKPTSFYLLTYRAWEFLGGALLSWWHYEKGHEEEVPPWRELMSLVGMALLVAGMVMINPAAPYPGWRAIVPVVGTLLLIEGGKDARVNRLLSHPVVVWVGLISYPLYLFHWPILSFLHIVKGEVIEYWMIDLALVLSIALSAFVYYLVERLVRYRASRWVMPTLISCYLGMCMLGCLIWAGLITTRNADDLMPVSVAIGDKDFFRGLKPESGDVDIYKMGGHGKQTLFIGDSNMMQYAPRVVELLKNNSENSRGAIFVCYAGLPPIPAYRRREDNYGKSLFPSVGKVLRDHPMVDRVVITCLWPEYFTDKKAINKSWDVPVNTEIGKKIAMESLDSFIQQMVYSGREVTLVLCVPYGLQLSPQEYLRRSFFKSSLRLIRPYSKEKFLSENGYQSLFDALKKCAANSGSLIVDPMDTLCHEGWCDYVDEEGIPIRYDHAHLRPDFVRKQVNYLDFTVKP
jgi:peptidoglycan/LPS O-acetylase OafA/YrhL